MAGNKMAHVSSQLAARPCAGLSKGRHGSRLRIEHPGHLPCGEAGLSPYRLLPGHKHGEIGKVMGGREDFGGECGTLASDYPGSCQFWRHPVT
jgi:hypothetical protein